MSDYRLILGDCLEVLPTLTGIDAVITDPPYGIGYAGSQSVGGTPGRKKAYWRDWATSWDESRASAETMQAILNCAPIVVIWGGNFYADILPPSKGWMVWDKTQRGLSFGDGELAWTNTLGTIRIFGLNRCHVSVDGKEHPTQKPIALMKWVLDTVKVPSGATVLDPFMGSGSTGVACIKTGRNFIGIERDPTYCAIAQKRIEQAAAQPMLFSIEVNQ